MCFPKVVFDKYLFRSAICAQAIQESKLSEYILIYILAEGGLCSSKPSKEGGAEDQHLAPGPGANFLQDPGSDQLLTTPLSPPRLPLSQLDMLGTESSLRFLEGPLDQFPF